MRKIKSCGVLIVEGDPIQRFLLMEHPQRWDLPKGHVDRGETELACALRELEEETAITADDIRIDPSFRFELGYIVQREKAPRERCQKKLVIFLAKLLRHVEIQPTEHEGFRWVDWNPPHRIQQQTIDPLLAAVQRYVDEQER